MCKAARWGRDGGERRGRCGGGREGVAAEAEGMAGKGQRWWGRGGARVAAEGKDRRWWGRGGTRLGGGGGGVVQGAVGEGWWGDAGVLAAWFRLKYPHVAAGALSSSSPILYFDHLTSPFSFSHIVSTDFRSESENCYKTIKSSWNRIEDTAKQPGGLHLLLRSFRICKSDSITVDTVTNWIRTAYVYTAMTDYPTASNFLRPLPAYPVKQMCAAIDEPRSEDTFAKVYGAVNIYYNYSGSVKDCFDLETPSDQHGLDEWTWQACTEMVMLTGGDNEESMFPTSPPDDYDSWVSSCQLMYDIQPRPHWITTEFGAHDIRRVLRRYGSNIIFFNGLRDPWSSGGVRSNISDTIVAIVAEKGAHHVDLRFSTKEDPEWLRQVRESEITIIKKWLDEYYFDLANFPSQ